MSDSRFRSALQPSPGAGIHPRPDELGFVAWSGDPSLCIPGTATVAAAGVLALRRISLPGVTTLTAVHFNVSVVGATLTANRCFAGVWDASGNLVGLSDNQATAWTSLGLNTCALTGGSGLPSDFTVDTPYIYCGYWYTGTTPPFMLRNAIVDASQVNGLAAVPAARARNVTADTGLGLIGTAPLRLGTITKSTVGNFWCAVS